MIQRHGPSGEDSEHREPEEGLEFRQPRGGREEQVKGEAQGKGRGVHKGVAPSPAGTPAVGEGPRQGIGDGVEAQGDHDGEARERAR